MHIAAVAAEYISPAANSFGKHLKNLVNDELLITLTSAATSIPQGSAQNK
jgi:hypothetical protein